MERRAVWRPRPDDPKTVLGWISQTGWPRTISGRVALFYTVALIFLSVAVSPLAILALPAVALNLGRPKRVPNDLTPLVTAPSPGPAFACAMSIERGSANAVIGWDEGIATFVGGWLHFAGLRTEFSFRAKDVRGFGAPGNNPRFRLEEVLVELGARDASEAKDLLKASRVWYESSEAEGDGPIMPPRTVHPSAVAKAWIDIGRSIFNGVAFGIVALVIMRVISVDETYSVIAPLFVFGGSGSRQLMALREFRKQELRALSNETKSAIGH